MVRKIELGVNTSLVAEVLNFINSNSLLMPSHEIILDDLIVTNLDVAKNNAWNETYGEDLFTWADLRSDKMSMIWETIYSDEDKYSDIEKKITDVSSQINSTIENQLDYLHRELLDDIVSDIKCCLFSRAVKGKENVFFERIFSIYISGGWPCGWRGNWPAGDTLIYYPTRGFL